MFIIKKKKKVLISSRPKSKGLLRNISWNNINVDGTLENGLPTIRGINFQEALMSHYKLGTNC